MCSQETSHCLTNFNLFDFYIEKYVIDQESSIWINLYLICINDDQLSINAFNPKQKDKLAGTD